MEQIKNGMLELAKYVAATQLNGGRTELGALNGESEFGKLLEQKTTEAKAEAPEKQDTADNSAKAEQKDTTEKKPESKKDEEETCDVAREAACAQMVWLVPQTNVEEQPVQQELVVQTEVGEMAEAVVTVSEGTVVQNEGQEFQSQMVMTQEETEQTAETAIPVEQTVEATEEVAQAETGKGGETQLTENKEGEVKIKVEENVDGEAAAVEAPLFKDVEAAPIKVAEAPAEVETSDVENQIADKLSGALENGESRMEIQLTPESLGKVTVELIRSADGSLSILLNAENRETRELLGKHINALQEAIVDRGQQNVQIQVNRGEEAQEQRDMQQDLKDGHNGRNDQRQNRQEENSNEDFLQQLRLGLIDNQNQF